MDQADADGGNPSGLLLVVVDRERRTETVDAAALVAVVDQADADTGDADGGTDGETGDAGRSQFGGG